MRGECILIHCHEHVYALFSAWGGSIALWAFFSLETVFIEIVGERFSDSSVLGKDKSWYERIDGQDPR